MNTSTLKAVFIIIILLCLLCFMNILGFAHDINTNNRLTNLEKRIENREKTDAEQTKYFDSISDEFNGVYMLIEENDHTMFDIEQALFKVGIDVEHETE